MKGQFEFPVKKLGTFHGFTAWFAVHFQSLETGAATVELNTGPNSEPTHWKQTLFMLDSPVTVHIGDSISGAIVLRRNPVWRRHMTVTIQWSINTTSEGKENCQIQTKSFPMWRWHPAVVTVAVWTSESEGHVMNIVCNQLENRIHTGIAYWYSQSTAICTQVILINPWQHLSGF